MPGIAISCRRHAKAESRSSAFPRRRTIEAGCIGQPRQKAVSAPNNGHKLVCGAVAGLIFFSRRVLLVDLSSIRSLLSGWRTIQYRRLRSLHALVVGGVLSIEYLF
jgi:hypothetical protein